MDVYGVLRSIVDCEVELMRVWRNSPTVRMNMYSRHEISEDEHRAWWARTMLSDRERYFMYECLGVPTGIVAFQDIDRANESAAWAFYADPHAVSGAGSRMEFLALEHAFNVMKLHKLHCEVFAFNRPVVRLHQKFGFQVEGTFREQRIVDGKRVDVIRLGMLSREWQSLRPQLKARIDQSLKG